MARLETIIDGSAEGLETAATRAIGILEGLQKVADKLKIDLFQATTVEDLNSVGVALTAVTGKYNDYVNAALKGNSVWQDQQASKALDALDAKLRVVNGNAELFGRTMAVDRQEVRAYQSALDSLLKAGLDPTDSRVQSLVGNINRLNATINAASSGQKNPFTQFENASGIIGNLENRLKNLRQALREATDTRQIVSLNRRIRETGEELARVRGLGDQATGMLGRLEAESKRLRTALTFAQSEKELEKLGAEIRDVEGEIARLNNVAGVMNRRFGSDGRQSFNQFGLEFGRVVQDLPYAANNFGSIGNNITRMVEVFPGYIAMLRATVIAQGQAVTSTTLLRATFASFFTGANAWLLGISVLVTAITFYTQWQQKAARETKKADKANRDYADGLDAVNRAAYEGNRSAQNDLSRIQLLLAVTRDAAASTEQRTAALKELQELYPRVFKNFDTETIKTEAATTAYKELAASIIASANAEAARSGIADRAESQFGLVLQNKQLKEQIELIDEQIAASKRRAEETRRSITPDMAASEAQETLRIAEFQERATAATREREKLQAQQTTNAKEIAGFQEEINTLSEYALNNQLKVNNALLEGNKNTKKRTSELKDQATYADRLEAAFQKITNRDEVAESTGLEQMQAKTRQTYQAVYDTIGKLERDWQTEFKEGTEQRVALDRRASEIRRQLNASLIAALTRDEEEYLAEQEAIRRKALADSVNVEVDTQRRLNERRSQTMLRALNRDLREWERAADERVKIMAAAGAKETEIRAEELKEQEALQRKYWERLEAIQQFERMERLANDFGDAFGRAFETSLSEGKNVFEQIYKEFRRLIIRMIAQQAALKAANIFGSLFGVGNVGDSSRGNQTNFGDLLTGIASIFGNSGAASKWSQGLGNIFKGNGEGGRFIDNFGRIFTSNQGGGGFLRTLGSVLSSGGSGGWLGKAFGFLGGLLGGSKYSSGNFPTGNFGGGNFPQYDNPQRTPAFVPQGIQSSAQSGAPNGVSVLRGNDIYMANNRVIKFNDRFNGGQ